MPWFGFPEIDPEIQVQVVYLRGEINTNWRIGTWYKEGSEANKKKHIKLTTTVNDLDVILQRNFGHQCKTQTTESFHTEGKEE